MTTRDHTLHGTVLNRAGRVFFSAVGKCSQRLIIDLTCRYVNKVTVQDLEGGRKWYFLCNSWLAIDVGECTLDKVFPVATEMDLKRFR